MYGYSPGCGYGKMEASPPGGLWLALEGLDCLTWIVVSVLLLWLDEEWERPPRWKRR